ncbi:hypothetical protein ES702_02252 [subsurface metagenome]
MKEVQEVAYDCTLRGKRPPLKAKFEGFILVKLTIMPYIS